MIDYKLEGPRWGTGAAGTSGGTVTWAVDGSVPAFFLSDIKNAFVDWSAHGNIIFQQVASTASANIVFSNSSIDGLSNVLGLANYTYSGQTFSSAQITFDSSEGWHTSGAKVISDQGFDLFLVALHEIGHSIGLDHYSDAPAVMNAYLDLSVTDLTTSDISGIQALYGAPSQPLNPKANEAPVAQNGAAFGSEDGLITGQVGATDANNDPFTYAIVKPVKGLTFAEDGSFTFDPHTGGFDSLMAGQKRTVTFQFTASDGLLKSTPATETLTITGQNDAPTAHDDAVAYTARGGAAQTVSARSLLKNDTDPDRGDVLKITGVDSTTSHYGQVSLNKGGNVSYKSDTSIFSIATGPGSLHLTDTFAYTVQDKLGATSTASVDVQLTGQSVAQTGRVALTANKADVVSVDVGHLSNVALNPSGAIKTLATITGFDGTQDTLKLLHADTFHFAEQKSYGGVDGITTLQAAATQAAHDVSAAGAQGEVFEFGGSTYVYADQNHSGTFDAQDGLLKLAGAHLFDLHLA